MQPEARDLYATTDPSLCTTRTRSMSDVRSVGQSQNPESLRPGTGRVIKERRGSYGEGISQRGFNLFIVLKRIRRKELVFVRFKGRVHATFNLM